MILSELLEIVGVFRSSFNFKEMGKTNSKPRENRLGLDYEILATEGNTIHLVNNSNQQVLQLKTISTEAAALPWVVPLVSRAVVLQHDHLSPVIGTFCP